MDYDFDKYTNGWVEYNFGDREKCDGDIEKENLNKRGIKKRLLVDVFFGSNL